MPDTWQTKGSFLFGTTDMFVTFGIKLADNSVPEDVLIPGLRSRKQTIPLQHGAYDYGAQYYDERQIRIECVTNRTITRADVREIAYILSKKSEIRLWNEPEKYYIGRVYNPPTLEQIRNVGNRFEIEFICDPFAYRNTFTEYFTNRRYSPAYQGTAATPTYIVIENTGSGNITNIRITQTDRKDVY